MTNPFFERMIAAFDLPANADTLPSHSITGTGNLTSFFAVTDLAVAAIGAAGTMVSRYCSLQSGALMPLAIDRHLASLWFGMTLRPKGWQMPNPWDPIAGDYPTKDGWIRLHTNAPHHRAAALSVLDNHTDRGGLLPVVAKWSANDLEAAIISAGGCAATMRSLADWNHYPQGIAVAEEPLIHWQEHEGKEPVARAISPDRPLANIRVLDLTRVLAGPVAGRFLAAYGADVLRIDPPNWDEPGVIAEVTLGKRCAGLDLKSPDGRAHFEALLRDADILLHGYRPDALPNLGYDTERLRAINPNLITVTLNAYGWSGPWTKRRGFDSLVQMSSGIADFGMKMSGADKPVPLPVQALDHATGYLMAASALHGLYQRHHTGGVKTARLSLARVAHLLCSTAQTTTFGKPGPETPDDIAPLLEQTSWGPAHRIRFPLDIKDVPHRWKYPASKLRSSVATWGKRHFT